jgi:hypothetical protein
MKAKNEFFIDLIDKTKFIWKMKNYFNQFINWILVLFNCGLNIEKVFGEFLFYD